MEYRGLRIAKTLLFRLFWVQLIFLLLAWALYAVGKDSLYPWIFAYFKIHIDSNELAKSILIFFGIGKFVLYCVYLVPAIAICWTLRHLEKKP